MIRLNAEYVSILKANFKRQILFVDSVKGQLCNMASFLKLDSTNIYNIDATQFSNNSFKIEVPTAATASTISIALSDDLADIKRSIQTAFVNTGAFLIDSTDNNFDFSATPASLPPGYTRSTTGLYSSGGTGLPTTTRVPRVIIDNAAFGKVVGLTSGTYPTAPTIISSAQLSNTIPQIHPSSSYVVRCDIIKNQYVASGDILSAFDRGDAQVGQLISYKPSQYAWMNCFDGSRSSITISMYNQNDQKAQLRDTQYRVDFFKNKIGRN
ncbi:uncharacterized protein PITG_20020 [Phytophthora infestans T30-4]|uniref:Uncharacterized protein n=1 Tax=Phytophthora infestans (strain T30-4) TaxID=403677 RepID=D0P1P1_PHYIT|nr:uncharacterized protein PITG_20020 [Phytophthora infestans T30-4]EEY54675.1 conserved hypothetical protein [Phytophthora infestans T30-4]|eukprot:XP_002895769.1 conserved hypothetical protein [Phytophthora infestans T30-4]